VNRSCCACDNACVSAQPIYYGELFTNARGGISTNDATQYQALFDLPLTFNFERLDVPLPGRFHLLAQNTHGRGLTEDSVGDAQVLSNIDSFDNIMRVSEYWWECDLLDDRATIRLGKQDINQEFLLIKMAEDFIQSSFGISPAASLPTYPDPTMAGVMLINLNDTTQLKLGVWNRAADGGGWGISEDGAVLAIVELEHTYSLFDGLFPGTVSVAGGYSSNGRLSGEAFAAVHGYSVQLEQLIFREVSGGRCSAQGLGLFAAYYPRFLGEPALAGSIGDSFVAGCVYTGVLPNRDEDTIGVGVAWAELFEGGANRETAIELFYKVNVSTRLSLQPDLQYIATPSGIHRDSLAIGVRFQLSL
jgi:porin